MNVKRTVQTAMKINRTAFLLVLIAVGLAVVANAQNSKAAQIRAIDKYCSSIDAEKKRGKSPELVFADTKDYNAERSMWRKFASAKQLEKFRETNESYTVAFVWRKAGKVAVTNFADFSPSGDWAEYRNSYYRADGTLARAETEFRTFQGDYIFIHRRYYDSRGRVLKSTSKSLDLRTRKPKKLTADFAIEDRGWNRANVHMTTAKLPFAKLIKKR
jgi:uncharacterized protein (DUF2141 family)